MPLEIIRGTENAPIDALRGRRVAIIGYGNQGQAHALNLRDSGIEVVVGCRPGGNTERRARADGFAPQSIADAADRADLVIMAVPDQVQPEVLRNAIIPRLKPGATIGFMHGFVVHYRLLPDHLRPHGC